MEDDLVGGPADQQVTFGLDGLSYEIDLNSSNADNLRELLAPYTAAGRRTGGRQRRQQTAQPARSRSAWLSEVRDWARANGHEVAERGRVSKSVIDAYNAANS